jgi:zinc transport system substrate-binding protein
MRQTMNARVANLSSWTAIGLLFVLGWVWLPACRAADRLQVTCTTTLIESAVRAIGQERVSATTIVPFGMCPGHFDISPREVARIKGSDLFLAHGFERFLKDLAKDDKDTISIVSVGVQDNWMIPSVYCEAVERITDILSSQCPASAAFFQQNAARYQRAIRREERRLRGELAYLHNTPVLCSELSASFVTWMGFVVAATFPRDEDISVKGLRDIVRAARRAGVRCVFDNLQSSGRVGSTLASELEVPVVMLSNFPLGKAPSYLATLEQTGQKITTVLHAPLEPR